MRWNLFFFDMVEWGIKKSVFSFWFQKCTYDLNKKCTQEKFCPKKTDFFRTCANFQLVKKFFGYNFFWVHFLLRSYVQFWNQDEKTDFLMPHSSYSKNKSSGFFENLKGHKWKKLPGITHAGCSWINTSVVSYPSFFVHSICLKHFKYSMHKYF